MNGPQKRVSKAQEKAKEFFQRHAKRAWTPAFNGHLEALIHDATVCLELRAAAWIQRYSWGNNEDSVCDANGIIQTQSDFARMVGLDRRSVSPAFVKFKRLGLIITKGQEIFPVDDPAFASSSPGSEGFSTLPEDIAKGPTFRAFIEEIVARDHPDKFKVYQERGQLWKEIRTDLLHLYDDYTDQLSGGSPTKGSGRPEALGQTVGEPDDASVEALRHSPPASLLVQNQIHISGESSSFSLVKEAFQSYAEADDDLLKRLQKNTRKATPAELVEVIHEKGRLIPKKKGTNRAAYLAECVVNAVASDAFQRRRKAAARAAAVPEVEPSIEEKIEELEGLLATMPKHEQVAQWREQLQELKVRKAAESEGHTKAKKAGQA